MMQEQKLNKQVIDPINAKEFERPFNSHTRLNDQAEKSSAHNQASDSSSTDLWCFSTCATSLDWPSELQDLFLWQDVVGLLPTPKEVLDVVI